MLKEGYKLNRTKEDLIESIKKSTSILIDKDYTEKHEKVIQALSKANFQNLEEGYEFNIKWVPEGYQVITHKPFWNEKFNAWDYADEKALMTIEL
ncbi:hypothetical protein IAI10_16465 [Clostridium sp. 19966]|uniref:hypothetical protein n=1 Tax=Clostridium sp. 19966 TaxID=2768166 RepID=UPI0028DECEBB|nr:hypothetical protein [Clostridium sp. 19966]MDT8718262.1 hypothetical protein [Clostridium sp. 19966]